MRSAAESVKWLHERGIYPHIDPAKASADETRWLAETAEQIGSAQRWERLRPLAVAAAVVVIAWALWRR